MPKTSIDQPTTQDTAALRSMARRIRSDMPQAKTRRNCRLLTQYFFTSLVYQKSRRIAFYYPVNNEAGSIDILTQSMRDGKECFLPVINKTNHSMKFIRVGTGTILKENAYRIPEPVGLCSSSLSRLDLLLIPLYYRRPYLIGLAHDNQKLSTIMPQDWDIPLDGIFTESGFKKFTNNNHFHT